MTKPTPNTQQVDVALVGGGIAGAWLLNLLVSQGYNAVLFEADKIGSRQTLASQGMIHGGIKYALAGALTGASEAISKMPKHWQACLAGKGDVDLSAVKPRSTSYYMFAESTAMGQLTTFFATKAMRGRINKISADRYPEAFTAKNFSGVVYEMDDYVLDTQDLLHALIEPVRDRIFQCELTAKQLQVHDDYVSIWLKDVDTLLHATNLVLTCGEGIQPLLSGIKVAGQKIEEEMQTRPLHQVLVKHDYRFPMYAHCLTKLKKPEPRLTITSHGDHSLWYLGGQIASSGVARSRTEQIAFARSELSSCLPWLDFSKAQFETLMINRAEPKQQKKQRPDEAYVAKHGPIIVSWPTKLSLAPNLGERVSKLLSLPQPHGSMRTALPLPTAEIGIPPWNDYFAA